MAKYWSFKNVAATETEPENVELRIEGDLVDDEDAWIYEWFGIQVASPNAFRKELKQYAGKDIKAVINSYGGSVFAGSGMYNALIEHKQTGGKVITQTDQKAMSAATMPFMAGDVRLMNAPDIFMMHNPLTGLYGYASDLRKAADVLDEVKECIINAYQIGSGRSRAKISQMMDDETYMSARTAIKEGFATDMVNGGQAAEIDNFAFGRIPILNYSVDSFKRMVTLQKPNDKCCICEVEQGTGKLVLEHSGKMYCKECWESKCKQEQKEKISLLIDLI